MLLQIVNMIINLILPRIIALEYGSATNGLVNSIRQFTQYISVVEGGLAFAAVYALYKPLADNDQDRINGILSGANRLYNYSGLIFSGLVLIGTFIYPAFVQKEGISPLAMGMLVLIIGAQGALEFFAIGKYKALFTADQKSYVISLINALGATINAIIIIVLVRMHLDFVLVWLFSLSSFIIRTLAYIIYARTRYRNLNFKAKPDFKALDKRWDSLILQILGAVTVGTPLLVITFMCGLLESSVYTVYNMVFASVLAILSTFNNGLSAIFGDMLVRNERISSRGHISNMNISTMASWAGHTPVPPSLSCPSSESTHGSDRCKLYPPEIGLLFVFSGLLYNAKTPQGMLVISAGLYKETKYQTLAQAIINIVVSVALAPSLGIAGVLLGSVVSNLYRTIDLVIFIPRVLTKLPVTMTVRRLVRMLILTAISILPPLQYLNIMDRTPNGYLGWLLWAIPTGLWCLLVFVLGNVIMERNTARDILLRVRAVFSRRRTA